MKFTSLTSVIITATAMAGIVIASVPVAPISQGGPVGRGAPAERALSNGPTLACTQVVGCSDGVDTYNNGDDFIYVCGIDGKMTFWLPLKCKDCCKLLDKFGNLIPGF